MSAYIEIIARKRSLSLFKDSQDSFAREGPGPIYDSDVRKTKREKFISLRFTNSDHARRVNEISNLRASSRIDPARDVRRASYIGYSENSIPEKWACEKFRARATVYAVRLSWTDCDRKRETLARARARCSLSRRERCVVLEGHRSSEYAARCILGLEDLAAQCARFRRGSSRASRYETFHNASRQVKRAESRCNETCGSIYSAQWIGKPRYVNTIRILVGDSAREETKSGHDSTV